MYVWAYSGASWAEATRGATAVNPVTCPPLDSFALRWPQKRPDVAVFNLHGDQHGQPLWYGQAEDGAKPIALTVQNVRSYDWTGVVVVAMVCWSAADGGQEMARAFLQRGALAFIGSTSEAYGRRRPLSWWQRLLGMNEKGDGLVADFIAAYRHLPNEPEKALIVAKKQFRATAGRLDDFDRLTLESFVCLRKKD